MHEPIHQPRHTHQHGRTRRLELDAQELREFEAVVLEATSDGIVLDRSAFYPGGGGQPPDHGALLFGGVVTAIEGARTGDDIILLPRVGDPIPSVGMTVRGIIDDSRRRSLMRTHSAVHLLSGVIYREFGALVTGGNMEPLSARIDFNLSEVPPGFREDLEALCHVEVLLDRTIVISELPR